MPTVARKDVLEAVYQATLEAIGEGGVPTVPLIAGDILFRAVPEIYLPRPVSGGSVSRGKAATALEPRDGGVGSEDKDKNRFTGLSYTPSIPAVAGLYCVLQQQALVNEAMHYGWKEDRIRNAIKAGTPLASAALANRCVIKIVLMSRFLMADLSPHNPGTEDFFRRLSSRPGVMGLLAKTQYASKVSFWERLVDGDDCSVARGVGLALSSVRYLNGIVVQTVRRSGRSLDEKGDNVVIFGKTGRPISGLRVDQVFYFEPTGRLQRFPLSFP